MGYYSLFNLTVEDRRDNPTETPQELIADLRESNDYAGSILDENGEWQDEAKWYDWKDDMRAFSSRHPNVLFQMRREGEDSGDIEVGYFFGGKAQVEKAQIVMPPYDPAKLR